MANHETSVSSASKPSPETSVISIYKMTKGSTMLKAKRHGTPQFKRFVLSRDLSHLHWGSPRKQEEKSVLTSQITQLLKGQISKGFASCPVPQKESISFSVMYKIGRSLHSVDIVCLDKQQYDVWTVGIQALIDGFNDKKSIDHLYDDTDGKPMHGTDEIPMSMFGSGGKPYNEDACDLYMWGDGTTGMLGHGENGEENVPRSVEALLSKDIWKVACGVTHTISLTSEGEVFSWGSGLGGKLGQGHLRDRSSPLRVAALKDKKVTSIACHEFHSAAVCGLGELFTWGQGGPRLGYESVKRKEILPRLVEGLQEHRVTEVACGLSHTLVCTRNGQCYAFGDNTYGQLGIPGIASSYEPVRSQELESFHISYIACGSNHSAALSDGGMVWLWGANHSGQSGLENVDISSKPNLLSSSVELRNHSIIDVSCGTKHTVLLSKKGKLFGMGDNTENQLGINQRGRTEEPILKVSVPSRIHLSTHSRASKPIQVSCGAFHTAVVTVNEPLSICEQFIDKKKAMVTYESGELFTWGKGKAGRLGHGDIRDRPLPCEVDMDSKRVRAVACGSTHTACLVTRAWVSDDLIKNCMACKTKFSLVNRKHHCRKCGGVFCASCTSRRTPVPTLPGYPATSLRRVCDKCYSLLLDGT